MSEPEGRRDDVASPRHPHAFEPSADRAIELDRAIRQNLIESVGRILEAAKTAGLAAPGDFAAWSARLAGVRRAPPRLWSCYHALVEALTSDDPASFERLVEELLGDEVCEAPLNDVVTLREGDLKPLDIIRYRRILDDNPHMPLHLRAVLPHEVTRLRALLDDAQTVLAAAPSLLSEMQVFGHQIVLVTNGDQAAAFGGAASVFLWGAVALNPTRIGDRLTLIESLVHETAHALLFGLTLGENLTRNDPVDQYPSPLRRDPRPMEGIVHAAYVLARMAYATDILSRAAGLLAAERTAARDRCVEHLRAFRASLATVGSHALFTSAGREIFENCRAAMTPLELRLDVSA